MAKTPHSQGREPSQGTRCHMPQQRPSMAEQINKYLSKESEKKKSRPPLAVQWLRFPAFTVRGLGLIPAQRTKIMMLDVAKKKKKESECVESREHTLDLWPLLTSMKMHLCDRPRNESSALTQNFCYLQKLIN